MRRSGLLMLFLGIIGPIMTIVSPAHALEEGEFVRKDGRWQYMSTEDPGLKYLLQKGIITQEEYDKGLKV
ncbi:MAG: hypothetical protein C4293_06860, partial [Nitrospiraceae bacterium]